MFYDVFHGIFQNNNHYLVKKAGRTTTPQIKFKFFEVVKKSSFFLVNRIRPPNLEDIIKIKDLKIQVILFSFSFFWGGNASFIVSFSSSAAS